MLAIWLKWLVALEDNPGVCFTLTRPILLSVVSRGKALYKERLIRIILPAGLLAFFIIISLYIRIAIPYDSVFSGGLVKFVETDAWYQLRLVDSLVHNFPTLIKFDPYTFFPHGLQVFWHPLFTYLMGGISMIVGQGAPDEHTVNMVAAFLPPVLGALTVIPVFFIGKALFNQWAGLVAAALIAIMPGEFLHRSMLGFTDHHAAEILFFTISILFLILALKSGKDRLSLEALRRKNFSQLALPLLYSALSGVFLGLYLLVWVAGLFFVLFFLIYFVIQFIVDHMRETPTQYLGIIGTVCFLCTGVIGMMFLQDSHYRDLYILALPIIPLVPLALGFISWFLQVRKLKGFIFPVAIVIIGGLAAVLFIVFLPSTFEYAMRQLRLFFPGVASRSITEVYPLLGLPGNLSLNFAMYNFSLSFFLSIIATGLLIYQVIKRENRPEILLLLVWSLFMFVAMLAQRRFTPYFTLNAALLSAYLAWIIIRMSTGWRQADKAVSMDSRRSRKSKRKEKRASKAVSPVNTVFGIVVIIVLIFYPIVGPLPRVGPWRAGSMPALVTLNSSIIITDAWYNTLLWLKDNTPDPFDQPDYYYELYQAPPGREDYYYPDSSYGVMALWDYGHMITRIAHRIPVSNPHQSGATVTARFFTRQDEPSANEILDEIKVRYILVDASTAGGKFHGGIIPWSFKEPRDFREIYYIREDGRLRGDYYYYPEYYKALAIRLYNFDAEAVMPQDTTVITFDERVFPDGEGYREITDMKKFSIYEQAVDYVNQQASKNTRIVGTSPYFSPIPLDPLQNYTLVHWSAESQLLADVGRVAEVKVFEYNR